jgi:hypothetical protein
LARIAPTALDGDTPGINPDYGHPLRGTVHNPNQLEAANNATREAVENTPNTTHPLLAPHYPAIPGQDLRGFGWDIDTDQSRPRGMVFPVGA